MMSAKEISSALKEFAAVLQRAEEPIHLLDGSSKELQSSIAQTLELWEKQLRALCPIDLEEYERHLPQWNQAWKADKESLIEFVRAHRGDVAGKRKKETAPTHSKRLLLECLQANLEWPVPQPEKPTVQRFVQDPEAHAILKKWGRLSEKAFQADLKVCTPELVSRAAHEVGITGKMTPDKRKKLHGAAVRFVNSTTLF